MRSQSISAVRRALLADQGALGRVEGFLQCYSEDLTGYFANRQYDDVRNSLAAMLLVVESIRAMEAEAKR